LTDRVDRVDAAAALLDELGAAAIDHPGGKLLAHLRRVHELVADWGGSERAQLAALCHATYGTEGFPVALLPLEERGRLREAIGVDAEALVYLYDACDRKATYAHLGEDPLPLTDRFTGEVVALAGADLTDFALLTVTNELDVLRHAVLDQPARTGLRDLFTALHPYVPDAASRALAGDTAV
jgi:hypothetical protein